uniref:Uncharacterized protein n=1 Tax=Zea mays TaxID=4577 RepID=C0PHC3_MAIZE|nr:unknown [Zea mays]
MPFKKCHACMSNELVGKLKEEKVKNLSKRASSSGGQSVDVDGACSPDLAVVGGGAHADPAHVDHGDGEVGEEGVGVVGGVGGHEPDVGAGEAVLQQRSVGGQQRLVVVHGFEVPHVEGGRRHRVQRLHAGHVGRRRAHLRQVLGVRRVQRRVLVAGAGVVVQASGEGRAVRDAEGVRRRQHHHVLHRQILGGEIARQHGGVAVGGGQEPLRVLLAGHVAVAPPGLHLVRGALGVVHGVARGHGHDVGAGHHQRARRLHLGLHVLDGLVPAHRRVGVRVPLRRPVVGLEHDGGVAPGAETVVEVEPEQARGERHVVGELGKQGVAHQVLHARARLVVVPVLQLRLRAQGRQRRHRELEHQQQPPEQGRRRHAGGHGG